MVQPGRDPDHRPVPHLAEPNDRHDTYTPPLYQAAVGTAINLACLAAICVNAVSIAVHIQHQDAEHRHAGFKGTRVSKLVRRLTLAIICVHVLWGAELIGAVIWAMVFWVRGQYVGKWWSLGKCSCRYYLPMLWWFYSTGFLAMFCFFRIKWSLSVVAEPKHRMGAIVNALIASYAVAQTVSIYWFRGHYDRGKCDLAQNPAYHAVLAVCYVIFLATSLTLLRLFLAPIKECLRTPRHGGDGAQRARLRATIHRNRLGIIASCSSTFVFLIVTAFEAIVNPYDTDGGVSFASFLRASPRLLSFIPVRIRDSCVPRSTALDIYINSCSAAYTMQVPFAGSRCLAACVALRGLLGRRVAGASEKRGDRAPSNVEIRENPMGARAAPPPSGARAREESFLEDGEEFDPDREESGGS